jgi:outer membrane protein OmpA-like peptidoglycan-associated protein
VDEEGPHRRDLLRLFLPTVVLEVQRRTITEKGMKAIIAAAAIALGAASAEAQTGVEGRPVDIYRYTLVQFPVDSPELGAANERIIREYICDVIRNRAAVDLTGYTDVVGLEYRNRELSLLRAETVAKAIRRNVPRSRYESITVRGVGEEAPLYANDLPEGRFYNRTVLVTITTPREESEN